MSSVFIKSLLGVLVGRKVTIILIFIYIQIFFQEKTSQRTNEKKKDKETKYCMVHIHFLLIHNFLKLKGKIAATPDCFDSNSAHCDTIVPTESDVLYLMNFFVILNPMKPIQRCSVTP